LTLATQIRQSLEKTGSVATKQRCLASNHRSGRGMMIRVILSIEEGSPLEGRLRVKNGPDAIENGMSEASF
jgi:hypothetical protein